MISPEHKKHGQLTKPALGQFGRNEYAVLGAPCPVIRQFCTEVMHQLSGSFLCGYADEEHANEVPQTTGPAVIRFTQHPQHLFFEHRKIADPYLVRAQFHEADLVLVNGNHFEAAAQVVIIDSRKKASLQKRVLQLNQPALILLADGETEVFDFIKEKVPGWEQLPLLRLSETEKIVAFFRNELQRAVAPLNGLVLSGGKSLRMGRDKTRFHWHGKEQRYYLADLMRPYCAEVFLSCREEQKTEMDAAYAVITDRVRDLGPYGALLSAFMHQPDRAWLVLATDLPLLDEHTLSFLQQHRDPSCLATTFESPFDGLPEPLITIWEPKSYPVLLSFLAQGISCPRKVLRNNRVRILQHPHPETLMNVNTPEDLGQLPENLKTAF